MIEDTKTMNTAADLSTTVSALGREVPVWVFLVVAVLLVLGGVAAIIVRRVSGTADQVEYPAGNLIPSVATVLFVAAAVVFLPPFAVLLQAAI